MLDNIINILYNDTYYRYLSQNNNLDPKVRKNYHIFNMHLQPQYYFFLGGKEKLINEFNLKHLEYFYVPGLM